MRIIGGRLRGRDLGRVSAGVRPTADRVRESLFSALGDVGGRRVLDLFAGSGALGLEAFSRGARSVVFVERSRRIARALSQTLARLDLEDEEGLRVLVLEARRAIRRLEDEGAHFDLVFVDPPYAAGEREAVLVDLFSSSLLASDAVVVVEGPKRHPLPFLSGARRLDERRYGETLLTWLAPAGADPTEG
jgi:16S rRNA (guanine(966)-N(2))-methyltransferase RsmD